MTTTAWLVHGIEHARIATDDDVPPGVIRSRMRLDAKWITGMLRPSPASGHTPPRMHPVSDTLTCIEGNGYTAMLPRGRNLGQLGDQLHAASLSDWDQIAGDDDSELMP